MVYFGANYETVELSQQIPDKKVIGSAVAEDYLTMRRRVAWNEPTEIPSQRK